MFKNNNLFKFIMTNKDIMLLGKLTDAQLLEEAEKLMSKFEDICDKAFKTLAIQRRIEEARAKIPNVTYALVVRTALQQRGMVKKAREFDVFLRAARSAADCYDPVPTNMYKCNQ